MKKWIIFFPPQVVALVLGASLTLAFAPYSIFPLAVIALAGLQALLIRRTPKQAFWIGFLFGVGLFGTGVHWVYHSIHFIGEVPIWLSLFITGGMIAILSCYPALACFFTNRYFSIPDKASTLCAFPAIWVLTEWLRCWLFTGFPWLLVGYSQTDSPLSGYAPILSVYGISLAVALCSSFLLYAIYALQKHFFKSAYFCLLGIVVIWIGGGLLSLIDWTANAGNPISVSLVQGNIPQELKWSPENLELSFETYTELTNPLWGKSDLIIWPEAAIPLPLQNATSFIDEMNEKAQTTNTSLILGIPIRDNAKQSYYNAIVTLGKDQKVYLKRHLVPFGEYTPFSNWLENTFTFMDIPLAGSIPGKMVQDPLIINGVKIAPSICYEITYPELTRFRENDIGLLLTVTNDAWFGRSNAQAQHLQMAAMRAQELRRPLLFVSNDGITAIINAKGIVESAAPSHQAYVLQGTIQPTEGVTPWMQNGTDPILALIILLLFISIRSQKKAKQNHSQRADQWKHNIILTQ